jgi:hypothetical protein
MKLVCQPAHGNGLNILHPSRILIALFSLQVAALAEKPRWTCMHKCAYTKNRGLRVGSC